MTDFLLSFSFFLGLAFHVIFIPHSPSRFALQETANLILDGIYLIYRLILTHFIHIFADMYDIMDYLFIARCMGYNAIHGLRSLVLRSRDEPSPKSLPHRHVNLTRLVFMDFDFRCNRLSCRKSLTDKAVVVSNPHMSLT